VKEADLILVLQNGELVQQGDYASLANNDGAFRALMQQQGV
jgi:ABC-type multidrug transport system fused ATPase/permease subunit